MDYTVDADVLVEASVCVCACVRASGVNCWLVMTPRTTMDDIS